MTSIQDSRLQTVRLNTIKSNPHRQLGSYPPDRRKVEALKRSIKQVGFWEGVIVRPAPDGDGYECAFGHHRLIAAREQIGQDASVSVILRDLDDGEMLQFMGRENAEDQRGNFLVMLETWEAALRFLESQNGTAPNSTDVGSFLGWIYEVPDSSVKEPGRLMLSGTAYACNAAYPLLAAGEVTREVYNDLSVAQARELAQTLNTQFAIADKTAKLENSEQSRNKARRTKDALVDAAKMAASLVRTKDRIKGAGLREEIIDRAYGKTSIPNIDQALSSMCQQVTRWNTSDFADKLEQVCAAIQVVRDNPDTMARYAYLRKDLETAVSRCRQSIDMLDRSLADNAPVSSLKLIAVGE